MIVDLHTHSLCSDGTLSPDELLDRAVAAGVGMLSITDHDTLAAYTEAVRLARPGLSLVPGIELSAQWRRMTVHVLGLRVDPDCTTLSAGVGQQLAARQRRAVRIGERLHRCGIEHATRGAARIAGHDYPGRGHFARLLVEQQAVPDYKSAFRRYLGRGKPAAVASEWANLGSAVSWIRASGGNAVLAHPAAYGLTRSKLKELVKDFVAAGGDALEVVTGSQHADLCASLARLANDAGLGVSAGSDFHSPDQAWRAIGCVSPLPAGVRPIWESWRI